ncbi:MAG: bifunctional UDP-N-acetylglucosamine diphosphorylase/glucosamine-1-phosphate N-acetyltransferase GlmU [Cyanobacteria bacterium HKST-UBA02]|nr:bifunctional UDP-N-acetylglucosamine diphosphorylase/glucosamine-1-phosphate N-acetyltransferase GlmU [Cyanobacteria bacterium HKST-UBA02]
MSKLDFPVRAVILAAGQGKRMKSSKPKVLHEVLGSTIIERLIASVGTAGVEHAHLVIGHGAEQVESYLESRKPDLPYSTHLQEPQLGTGHALMQVVPALSGFKGCLFVTVGDEPLLRTETIEELCRQHKESGSVVTVLSTIVPDAKNYGRIVRDGAGNVVKIVEDREACDAEKAIHEINSAIYCFSWPEIEEGLTGLKNDNNQKEYYLTDLVFWAREKGLKLSAMIAEDYREVAGINSRLELSEVWRHLRDRTNTRLALESGVTIVDPASTWIAPEVRIGQDSVVYPNTTITGDVEIGPDCVIGPGAVIRGKVRIGGGSSVIQSVVLDSVLGANCKVGPFAHVREGNDVGDGVRVGNFVELKKCTIGNKTNVSHLSYVGDTKIGSHANIGAGTITANYDHLTKTKSSTVIGDGASTGSNSVIVAPVEIGDEAVVAAGSVVTRPVPSGALAVGRARQENKLGWSDRRKGK